MNKERGACSAPLFMEVKEMKTIQTPFGGTLEFYPGKEDAKNEMVLICPGGGYSFLSPREGKPIAEVFNQNGYQAAVLSYCLEKEVHGTDPLKELAWSVRWLRTDSHWKEKCRKIWLVGFSAGGHLAASLGVLWNEDSVFTEEEQQLNRPDGLILGYPVISMGEFAHPGSVRRLTGGDQELIRLFSLEKRDLSKVPPVFLWNTQPDEKVPAMNSLLFAQKLTLDGVRCEYHMFHQGLHGMSLATPEVESEEEDLHPDAHIAHWMELCLEWMKEGEK